MLKFLFSSYKKVTIPLQNRKLSNSKIGSKKFIDFKIRGGKYFSELIKL